ncbi:hypothetical protein SpyM6JRS4_02745 [Streptococcus pyogenes JRS4]|uniref:YueI family protein n=1 Tax=Streptococcus pyogenes TaxID=1314 RepID=UPI00000D9885|nr:YueI family protein [Streptococcus pyogenes]EQL78836.1 PF07997 family protein [Streptococcus pyogenes UTSW-2]EQL81967.1 PF07997 family protein [Streptococcus pyogenes GA19681]ESA44683.1 PF07997 family protein [Streptococcus pyogenes GA19700]ESA46960.1 PF07997 family protein [Streptococcus pyogenes GA41039]ESA50570.1 PF07997 family protein [Streptococcus pyogenes GA41208]ESA58569.1 PF07997 family protein [Streptococcus pyogenes GA40377]HER4569972.1 YueI family protein [Streptococcus pyogen
MTNLEDKLLKGAWGERRLNPEQQRYYLGTYAERVVLSALLDEAQTKTVKDYLKRELPSLQLVYQPLHLKISSKLAPQLQILYMKLAKENHLPVTIITETHMTSPFAFILHTDHAINLKETRLEVILKQTKNDQLSKQPPEKTKSFWKRFLKK